MSVAAVHALVHKMYQTGRLWPAAQPRSMVRANLQEVFKGREYVVSQKADGEHRALILGTLGTTPFCCFMDRCETLVFHQIRAPFYLFQGTLVLGEMVSPTLFLVFDVVRLGTTNLLLESYPRRMAAAAQLAALQSEGNFLIGPRSGDSLPDTLTTEPVVEFRVKPFYFADQFAGSFTPVTSLADGLIFMPTNQPLTRAQPFKWKEQEAHTVDLKVHATRSSYGDPWGFVITEPEQLPPSLSLDTQCPLLRVLEQLLNNTTYHDYSTIFECSVRRDPIGGHTVFVPIKIRVDKLHGNSRHTLQGTLHSFTDNISRQDLIQCFLATAKPSDADANANARHTNIIFGEDEEREPQPEHRDIAVVMDIDSVEYPSHSGGGEDPATSCGGRVEDPAPSGGGGGSGGYQSIEGMYA